MQRGNVVVNGQDWQIPTLHKMDDGKSWIRDLPQKERTELIEANTRQNKQEFGYLNENSAEKANLEQAEGLETLKNIGKIKCPNAIDPKVWEKLGDPIVQKQFKEALEKGIVGPTGENGIKIVDKTEDLAKLGYTHKIKIKADKRIYGKMGTDGKLFFDKIGTH